MPAAMAVAAMGIALRIAAFSPLDIMHADELMQYLEQANRLATGYGIVPWEARFGLRNALIEQFLAPFLWLGGTLAPGTLLGVYLARGAFAAMTLLVLPAAWRLGALASWRHAMVALLVAAAWWESVLFSELLLSESLASALLLLAAAPLLEEPRSRTVDQPALRLSGFLLGLGVLVRLQYAPFAVMLALGTLRFDRARWRPVFIGGMLALLLGAASDLAMGRMPFAWMLVNVTINIGQGAANRFGISGPFAHLAGLYVHLAPVGVAVLMGALFARRRYRPLLAAALVNLLVHSLIAHKEYRFVWLTTLTLLLLAAVTSVDLVDRIASRRARQPGGGSPAVLVLLCLVWLAASAISQHVSGGFRAFRGGGGVPKLAIEAVEDPGICGIGLDFELRAHLVPSLLTRRVPIALVPLGPALHGDSLPRDLAPAVNALILTSPPNAAEGYHVASCRPLGASQVCLYRRAGTCRPSQAWDYQQVLDRTDKL
ncbi:Alg9-like mannosyltransferase family protein [Novosphingobium sp. CF614]|nr:Alg9-like mannosyltransferase family protein [Novosphingobium sp. CF614]